MASPTTFLQPQFHPDSDGIEEQKSHPEEAVKNGGLPAMLKALRGRQARLRTTSSLAPGGEYMGKGDEGPMAAEVENSVNLKVKCLARHLETSDLERRVIRQVEHYFGNYNLPKDRFMHEQMDPDGWISMNVMLTFKRLKGLTLDDDFIMEALNKSTNKLVQVDFTGRQIRRNPDNPLPSNDEATKLDVQNRTVFVSGFHRENTTLDDLLYFFGEGDFEPVCYVRMRFRRSPRDEYLREESENRKFLGSIFVAFESIRGAENFIKRTKTREGVKFKNRRLNAKFQKEFFDRRIENNDEFSPNKVMRTVYVQGFDKTDLSDQDVANFFSLFDGAETVRKRVYRDNNSHEEAEGEWKFSGSVFVCFDTEKAAEAFIRLHRKAPVTYLGDRLKVRTQLDFYEEMGKFKRRIREFKAL